MNSEKYAKYVAGRGEVNSFILDVFEEMQKAGELEGLSDEEALEKVVSRAEEIKEKQ